VTATVPVDPSCRYEEGSFPHFTGLADSVMYVGSLVLYITCYLLLRIVFLIFLVLWPLSWQDHEWN
jgi:hypothetical protein